MSSHVQSILRHHLRGSSHIDVFLVHLGGRTKHQEVPNDVVIGEIALAIGLVVVICSLYSTESLKHVIADRIMAVSIKLLCDAVLPSQRGEMRHVRRKIHATVGMLFQHDNHYRLPVRGYCLGDGRMEKE